MSAQDRLGKADLSNLVESASQHPEVTADGLYIVEVLVQVGHVLADIRELLEKQVVK